MFDADACGHQGFEDIEAYICFFPEFASFFYGEVWNLIITALPLPSQKLIG